MVVREEVYYLYIYRYIVRYQLNPDRVYAYKNIFAYQYGRYRNFNGKVKGKIPSRGGRGASGCTSVLSFTDIFIPRVQSVWVEALYVVIFVLGRYGYLRSLGGVFAHHWGYHNERQDII